MFEKIMFSWDRFPSQKKMFCIGMFFSINKSILQNLNYSSSQIPIIDICESKSEVKKSQ